MSSNKVEAIRAAISKERKFLHDTGYHDVALTLSGYLKTASDGSLLRFHDAITSACASASYEGVEQKENGAAHDCQLLIETHLTIPMKPTAVCVVKDSRVIAVIPVDEFERASSSLKALTRGAIRQ